jgi:hypothetical protein
VSVELGNDLHFGGDDRFLCDNCTMMRCEHEQDRLWRTHLVCTSTVDTAFTAWLAAVAFDLSGKRESGQNERRHLKYILVTTHRACSGRVRAWATDSAWWPSGKSLHSNKDWG